MDLILPASAVRPSYTCICGKAFYSKRAGMRHTASCTEAEEMCERHVVEQESNVFTSYADPEARAWIDRRLSEGKPGAKNGRPS